MGARTALSKAKSTKLIPTGILHSYLSKLSLVLMKKSNFCFAYSITSEWSSTPWLTPKGPASAEHQGMATATTQNPAGLTHFGFLPPADCSMSVRVAVCVGSALSLLQWELQPCTRNFWQQMSLFCTIDSESFALNYAGNFSTRGKRWCHCSASDHLEKNSNGLHGLAHPCYFSIPLLIC